MALTGLSNGVIKFSEPNAVYYSGQLLSGSVEFELRDTLTFTALNVELKGEANVSWTEDESEEYNGVKRYKTVKYLGKERYFHVIQSLTGGSGLSQLPPGTHTFSFQCQIPFTAPSTYSGEFGKVEYEVNVFMDFPNVQRDVLEAKFKVVAPMDLNGANNDAKEPIQLDFEEIYGCCCGSRPVEISVRLPVAGYCPGQAMPLSVQVANSSNVEVTDMIFELVERTRYRSQQPVSVYCPAERALCVLRRGPVLASSRKAFTFELAVPDDVAPNLDSCAIIDVRFFLKVLFKFSGCNNDLEDEAEVFLGLVPLSETIEGKYVHPSSHCLPTAPLSDCRRAPPGPQVGLEPTNSPYHRNLVETAPLMQHQTFNTAYPNSNPGYPISAPGYPTSTPGYPTPAPGYPTSIPGYPTSSPGYPTSTPGYPNTTPGYPNPTPGYPNPTPGYPNPTPGYPYPSNNVPPYPTNPPPYPTAIEIPPIPNLTTEKYPSAPSAPPDSR